MTYNQILLTVYSSFILLFSIISFSLYIKDKKLATKSKMRIKEKTLLSFTCFGGAIGSLLGRIVAHHKTNKVYFSIVIWISLIVQLAVFAFLCYLVIVG